MAVMIVMEYGDVCEVIDTEGEVHAIFTDAVEKQRRKDRAVGWAAANSGVDPSDVEVVQHGA